VDGRLTGRQRTRRNATSPLHEWRNHKRQNAGDALKKRGKSCGRSGSRRRWSSPLLMNCRCFLAAMRPAHRDLAVASPTASWRHHARQNRRAFRSPGHEGRSIRFSKTVCSRPRDTHADSRADAPWADGTGGTLITSLRKCTALDAESVSRVSGKSPIGNPAYWIEPYWQPQPQRRSFWGIHAERDAAARRGERKRNGAGSPSQYAAQRA